MQFSDLQCWIGKELQTNAAIRIPTVSFTQVHQNTSTLREKSLVKHEVVANYSHLFTVLGSDPELVPYSHLFTVLGSDPELVPYSHLFTVLGSDPELVPYSHLFTVLGSDPELVPYSHLFTVLGSNPELVPYSHLFTVLGSDPELVPYMLLAHIDVVPADEADGWEAPPFSAEELNGYIYGRGTIDNKQSVMRILQALEYLLERRYVPQRGFYIGLGHDEEVNGFNGAVNIVKVLKRGRVKLQYVLDEGLAVLDGIISGLDGPAALIGVSEKGQATVKLSVSMRPGHSSMPPRESSIGILAAAITRLEESPMPRLFGYGSEQSTFEHLAHKFHLPLRFIMANLWLFNPLMSRVMERRPEMNAFVRTTTAVTMFNSGVKVNVLPSHAEAVVNLRIHSAQTLQEVLDLIKSIISDNRVKMELMNGFDPLPISSYDDQSFGFQIIKKTVLDMFPHVTVAPGICIGNTDSRHYTDLTQEIYRFGPTWLKPGEPERFHGISERISPQNYEELFYFRLIQTSDI